MSRATYRQRREARARRGNLIGAAMLGATALGLAGLLGGAYIADNARGITVSESLCSNGLGCGRNERDSIRAKLAGRPVVLAESSVEPRLIGYCAGKLLVAAEESAFPAPCAWIERADSIKLPSGASVTVY